MAASEQIALSATQRSGHGTRWGEDLILRPPPPESRLRLDLSKLGFVEPLYLLRLRAFLDWHSAKGTEVLVVPPRSTSVQAYLARMKIAEALPELCNFELPEVTAHDRSDVLLELTRLKSLIEGDQLDDLLQEVVGAHFEGDSAALTQPFLMAVGEMADNALSHGRGADTGAYVAAQRYEKKRLVMAIGDTGVGIPDHLREQFPHLTNDGEAIEEATKEGVTAARNENRNHRGMGYVHLTEAMTDAKMSSGSVRIWSGCGRYQFSVRNGQVFDREPSVTNERTAGTWVRVELSV